MRTLRELMQLTRDLNTVDAGKNPVQANSLKSRASDVICDFINKDAAQYTYTIVGWLRGHQFIGLPEYVRKGDTPVYQRHDPNPEIATPEWGYDPQYMAALARGDHLKGLEGTCGFDRNASHAAGRYVCTCGKEHGQ